MAAHAHALTFACACPSLQGLSKGSELPVGGIVGVALGAVAGEARRAAGT
jgi:hypothetical protein